MMYATRHRYPLLALASALALSACGSGGGSSGGSSGGGTGGTPPSPPPNSAPVITSAASANVAENTAGIVYTATATDADGNPITWTITGGVDAAKFSIATTGQLSLRAPADFEAPTDANADNVYVVQIGASDGTATTNLALQLTVTDVTTGTYRVRQIAAGLTLPNNLVAKPGDGTRVFVTEKGGLIKLLTLADGSSSTFLDLRAQVATDFEGGLLGIAPDPNYASTGFIYVALTTPAKNLEVRRYRAAIGTRELGDPASGSLILSVPTPDNRFAGGWVGFGPDGFLYVTTGHGPDPGSSKTDLLGKVLRFYVAPDGSTADDFPADPLRNYSIPNSNPFSASNPSPVPGGGSPEIWAVGFRQPRRAAFDTFNGSLFVSDWGAPVGDSVYETELNWIRTQDAGYDWTPWRERLGSSAPLPAGQFYPLFKQGYGLSDPSTFGPSVYGTIYFNYVAGPVYRGTIEPLQGRLIYGEVNRTHFAARVAATLRQNVTDNSDPPETNLNAAFAPADRVLAFGEDASRNLYILTPDGKIFVVEPT